MARKRFDRRVLALVEVRGGDREWAEAKAAFEARGWPVTEEFGRGEGASAGVLRPRPGCLLLRVEVRLFGAVHRAERGAAWRVQRLARRVGVEMYVRRAQLLHRDRELLPGWYAHSTDHRPPVLRRPAASGAGAWAYRWARAVARSVEGMGRHDVGVVLTGTPSEARRLARMPGEESGPGLDGWDVRPADGRARSRTEQRREDDLNGRIVGLSVLLTAMLAAAVLARGGAGFGRYVMATLAAAAFCAVLRVGSRLYQNGGARSGAVAAGIAAVFLLSIWVGVPFGVREGMTRSQTFVLLFCVLVLAGLWLLVRQWTVGEWLAWGGPVVAAFVGSSLLAAGSVMHTLYADGLSLTPGDLGVPGVWQAIAVLRLLLELAPILLVPACYGFAKHFHYVRSERWGIVVTGLLLVLLTTVSVQSVLDSAARASDRTIRAAEQRKQPPPYFGVAPEWMCVEPVVPGRELAGEGGRLVPQRPYVTFGIADGDVVLWDTDSDGPMKLPAEHVRLVPTDSPQSPCGGA
ncbi:NnrS multi-domain protein [Streptomyces sp. N2-109]|uniref:NnrS multi-domain protein n=1 Tax=Streptomyces gossypii TaxID=2883101 RepID=A0ABT2JU25_9ACTN|nr:NnrS multi-domain protein [Streptomyces gossypii]MCT2590875.1 NnrS multi-domain protein [Streptomyces gossypii]